MVAYIAIISSQLSATDTPGLLALVQYLGDTEMLKSVTRLWLSTVSTVTLTCSSIREQSDRFVTRDGGLLGLTRSMLIYRNGLRSISSGSMYRMGLPTLLKYSISCWRPKLSCQLGIITTTNPRAAVISGPSNGSQML